MPWLVLAAFLAAVAPPAGAEPKILGQEPHPVRIIRGSEKSAPAARVAVPAIDLDAPAPAGVDSLARATAAAMVEAFGGPLALRLWSERGEVRGRQSLLGPARAEARVVERRAGPRRRVDLHFAGTTIAFVVAPEGAWQDYVGLVSDLPEHEEETIRVEQGHDETLLLGAAFGELPARLDPGAAGTGEAVVVVWGPRGSATRFRAEAATGRLRSVEFRDRDPRGGGGRAVQRSDFDDWRAFGPGGSPWSSPRAGWGPARSLDHVDGEAFAESVIDTVDLGAAFDDSIFARPGSHEATVGPSRRTIVPLVRQGDHHFVQVRVGGGAPRLFLVDTGAGMTALSQDFARELGMAGGEPVEISELGGATAAEAVPLPPLTVGTFTLTHARGLVLDLEPLRSALGEDVAGILGFSSLARYAVTFDFANGTIELAENAQARTPGAGGARVPFDMVAGQVIVPVSVDGGSETGFLLDSGAWRTFLPPEVADRLAVPADLRLPGIPSSGAAGSTLEADALRVRSLTIGQLEVSRPIVLVPSAADSVGRRAFQAVTRARGVLGADILRRFRLTVDFPRQELTLEPRIRAAAATRQEDESEAAFVGPGVVLAAGAPPRVRLVLAGSPAARAGIRAGDRVTAIGRAPTAGLSIEEMRRRLGGPVGSTVRLTVRPAGGGERMVELERVLLL
jgi:predicted aspartyl protease